MTIKHQEHPLTNIYKSAPVNYLPTVGTNPYVLLKLLADGNVHRRSDLIKFPSLGESMRSALQSLRDDHGGNWLIHSVPIPNEKATGLQLDHRHLSGDQQQDADARMERKRQYKQVSYQEARQGRIREPKAFTEMTEAQKEYLQGIGEAANDSNFQEVDA